MALAELQVPLSPAAKALLTGEILVVYVRVRWWLRSHEIATVVARVRGSVADAGAGTAAGGPAPTRLARAVTRTLRLLPTDSRCLVRSLVLTALLARRGLSCTVIIGVRTEPQFAAHAWVEREGRILLPTGPEFRRLVEL